MGMAAPAAGGDAPAAEAEEQTEFDVILKEVPKAKKIAILKVIRTLLGLGLRTPRRWLTTPARSWKVSLRKCATTPKRRSRRLGVSWRSSEGPEAFAGLAAIGGDGAQIGAALLQTKTQR